MRLFRNTFAVPVLLAACISVISAGCSTPAASEGFAIYLTRNDVPPADMEKLSHVDLAEQPIISMDDVVSYDASTHEMTLAEDAIQRLNELKVPTSGKSFMVCVDGSPVYWGAFWVLYSSQSFDGVTIWLPLILDESPVVPTRMGYPWDATDAAGDPRNHPQVLAALEKAGKLIVRPPALTTGALPQSLKGYELYSWQEGNEWHFTLITGTNRNKTAEEVLSREPLATGEGWVHVHAAGIDEVKAVLSRVPEAEYVIWFSQFYGEGGEAIALPPRSIIEDVSAHATQRGLNFSVML